MQACSGTCKNSRVAVTNSFHAIDLFPYPLKTSENQRFFYVFRVYRKCSERTENVKLTQNENVRYASAFLLALLYVLLAFDVSQNQGFKKEEICATLCNWLQLIAVATVCNWFKYKCFQIVKQVQFLFSWGIKSALHSFMFIYLSLPFSLYKYLYAHIFICKHPFTLWWFHGNCCTWANGVPKCTGCHKTVMEGMWQYPFILNCRGSNKMHQEEK